MEFSFASRFPEVSNQKTLDNLREQKKILSEYISDTSCQNSEGFLAILDSKETISTIVRIVSEKTKVRIPNTVFVVGIGGANLATKAVYDALYSFDGDLFRDNRKILFLDTFGESVTNPIVERIAELEVKTDCIVVVVSKSGKTLETLANAEFLLSRLEEKFGDMRSRIIAIGAENSPLILDAKSKEIETCIIPNALSDRYSAFSVTTLVPLHVFGFDIHKFLDGARNMRSFMFEDKEETVTVTESIFDAYTHQASIFELFYFDPRLETLGKWHRQLFAESLGKERGDTRVGMTPTISIGTTDLHSILQLRLAGPRDTVTRFISVANHTKDVAGDAQSIVTIPGLSGQKMSDIGGTILESVLETYKAEKLPHTEVTLQSVSLSALGAYMIHAMIETVLLARFWDVDPFTQPKVESYKEIARKLLQS